MRRPTALVLSALLVACAHRPAVAPAAPAAPTGARLAWELPGQGRLLLGVPPGWTATTGDADPPLPATVRLEPPQGRQVLLLTPTWDPGTPPEAPASLEAAHLSVELARRKAAESSVEVPLPLLELGGDATGWYFAATDRELVEGGRPPGPDEYRCLLQGAALVGGLTVGFTLLDDGDGPHRAVVLEVVRRARHLPPGARSAGGPARPEDAGEDEAARPPGAGAVTLAFPGKGWAVAVDLPGFEVEEPATRPDGRLVSVVGHHPASGLVASLVLSAAGARRSAAACAEADWLRLASFLPEVAGRAPPSGLRPRADYLVRDLRGKRVDQQNSSAWWYRDGVCVHAHVSLMGFEPDDQPALDRVLATVRFDEPL
jgi:hypothetical protein